MADLGVMTYDEFRESIIAQDDDSDYQESGYVAIIRGDQAAIANYSHCSCYETFADLCGGGISDWFDEGHPQFNWVGTIDEMIDIARRKADPSMPERVADPEDYDYDHLCEVYKQIVEWADSRGDA